MKYDGSIRIDTAIDQRGFTLGAKNLTQGVTRLGKNLNGIIKSFGFALGAAGLIALGKQAISTASDIEEVQNVVDTAFGKMSYKMEDFAKTAVKQFGISQLSAKETGSTFMAMGKSMVGNMETASNMAIALTGRAADMASFYNKSFEETSTALKAIYTGETEVLKSYGVVMTEVNLQEYAYQKGIKKKISAMTQAEKVQLRYNYVMEQTSLSAGDFAKTSDSWANQTRILSEQFKELLSVLGSGLITVLTPVVKFLNTILTQLIAISKQVGEVLSKLLGLSLPTADSSKFASDLSDAAGGADELTDAIEEAGKAANDAVAPFDKLNVLSKESGDTSDGTGIGVDFEIPGLEMSETVSEVDELSNAIDRLLKKLSPLFDWFIELKGLFSEGFFDGLGEAWEGSVSGIEESARNIIKNLAEIFSGSSVVAAAQGMVGKIVYALGQAVGSAFSIGLSIIQNLIGGMDAYLEENKDFLKEKLTSIFDIAGDIALLIGEASAAVAYVFEAFASENGQQLTANLIGIFTNAVTGTFEILSKLARDILNIFIQPFVDNQEEFRTAFEGLLGILSEIAGTIKQGIDDTFAKLKEVYDEHFKPFFESIANGLSDTVGKFMEFWNEKVQPILNEWAKTFDKLWKKHIQPLLDNFMDLLGEVADFLKQVWESVLKPFIDWIIENILPALLPVFDGIYNAFVDIVAGISDAISNIIDVLKGIIEFITGVFSGDWEKAFGGLRKIVEGVMNAIKNIINAALSAIGKIIEPTLKAIGKLVESILNGVARFISSIFNRIKSTFSNGLGSIKTAWSNAWNGMKNTIINIFNSIWTAIKKVINSIIGGIEGMANGVINGINAMIRALNKLSFDVPDWVPVIGGGKFGFNLKEVSKISIPRLADGAVIRGGDPFMAVLGDQKHGQTNIETPLPTMIKAFKQALAETGGVGGGEYTFIAQLDGKVIFDETVKQDRMYRKAKGRSAYAY